MRLLGHNGEINTLLGNINWMMAREADLSHPRWGDRLDNLKPIVHPDNSDSATLDNVLELLVSCGRSPLEALMIMVPEAYQNQPDLDNHPKITDFYEYYSRFKSLGMVRQCWCSVMARKWAQHWIATVYDQLGTS
jgi:glutamate synthase (ferredoxin)